MTVQSQYPHVRAMLECPRCWKPKGAGLLLCWPCHHNLKKRHNGGYGRRVEAQLAELESAAEASGKVAPPMPMEVLP